MATNCNVKRDFLRHIAMPKIAEALVNVDLKKAIEVKGKSTYDVKQLNAKVSGVLNDMKRRLSLAETSYNFSAYGGHPERLASYLGSPEWDELIRSVIMELKESPEALSFIINVIKGLLTLTMESYK
ncbi:MAG: hypothetical protein ACP5HK_02980, partial [Acidilobus sp.]